MKMRWKNEDFTTILHTTNFTCTEFQSKVPLEACSKATKELDLSSFREEIRLQVLFQSF